MARHVDGDDVTSLSELAQRRIPERRRSTGAVEQHRMGRFDGSGGHPVGVEALYVGLVVLDIDACGAIQLITGCSQRSFRRQCLDAASRWPQLSRHRARLQS